MNKIEFLQNTTKYSSPNSKTNKKDEIASIENNVVETIQLMALKFQLLPLTNVEEAPIQAIEKNAKSLSLKEITIQNLTAYLYEQMKGYKELNKDVNDLPANLISKLNRGELALLLIKVKEFKDTPPTSSSR